MNTRIFKGFITESEYGENVKALFIGDRERPLVEEFDEDFREKQVSVRYWISNKEKGKSELQESILKTLFGTVDAKYEDLFSEYTGYQWTEEDLKIGGHDLYAELKDQLGKFIWLEVDIH